MISKRVLEGWLCLVLLLCVTSLAHAKPPADVQVLAQLGAGPVQLGVAVGLRADALLVALCNKECDWEHALDLEAPSDVRARLTPGAVRRLTLGQGRQALLVEAPGQTDPSASQSGWQALVAGPLRATPPTDPPRALVIHAGQVGFGQGSVGQRTGTALQLFDKPGRITEVVVGELREDLQLCGRRALLAPKVLHPAEMKLRAIRYQRLADEELAKATRLQATAEPAPDSVLRLTSAGASTNPEQLFAAVDGDPSTAWFEKRGGDGAGEFLVLRVPVLAPLSAVHLVPSKDAGHAAPRTLYLATHSELFHVTLPDLGGANGFTVRLPSAVTTGCLALVLDTAQLPAVSAGAVAAGPVAAGAAPTGPGPVEVVALSEISVTTTLSAEDAVSAVLAPGPGSPGADGASDRAAKLDLLRAFGTSALPPLLNKFSQLPPEVRAEVVSLFEELPCPSVAPFYSRVLLEAAGATVLEPTPALQAARQGAQRCQHEVLPRLVEGVQLAKSVQTERVFSLIAELDPVTCVQGAVPLLASSGPAKRRVLRAALDRAFSDPQALAAAVAWLSRPELSRVATIDLLRALDSRLQDVSAPAAARALQLLGNTPSLRTRYLLLQPLSHLSLREPRAVSAFKGALSDPDPMLRTEAARAAPALDALRPELLRLAADSHVRVREAAVTTLGRHGVVQARSRLLQRLEQDAWPIVRAASVRALKELPADGNTSAKLAEAAASDTSAEVRRPALIALSSLEARAQLPVIRDRFREDGDPFVQAAAAQALGQLCDRELLDELTAEARKLTRFGVSERDGIVGTASLSALAQLAPPDLKQRLQPFFRPEVPIFVQGQARAALQPTRTCPR